MKHLEWIKCIYEIITLKLSYLKLLNIGHLLVAQLNSGRCFINIKVKINLNATIELSLVSNTSNIYTKKKGKYETPNLHDETSLY